MSDKSQQVLYLTRNGSTTAITEMFDLADRGIRLIRDWKGRVIRAESFRSANGKAATSTASFFYDGSDNLTKIVDPLGKSASFTYDDAGRVLTGMDAPGVTYVRNEYDDRGRIVKQLDSFGNETRIRYEAKLMGGVQPVTVTGRTGELTYFRFNAQGRLIEKADSLKFATTYEYDEEGNLVRQTDPLGNSMRRTYDSASNMLTETDATGATTSYEYTADGDISKITDPDGAVTRIEYAHKGRPSKVTEPNGTTTEYLYDYTYFTKPLARTVTTSDGEQRRWSRAYESFVMVAERDPSNVRTEFDVDDFGRQVGSHRFGKATGAARYDKMGNLLTETNAAGESTQYTYDFRGNVTSVKDANGGVTTYKYNANGKLVSETNPEGGVTAYHRDAEDRVYKQVGPDGVEELTSYGRGGLVVSKKEGSNNSTRYEYDGAGRLIKETSPGGGVTRYEYDAVGRAVKQADALGNSVSYAYTSGGKLKMATDQAGSTTTYEYDAAGNLAKESRPFVNPTEYRYNGFGELVGKTASDGGVFSYVYDALGRVTSETDGAGGTTTYEYDGFGSLVKKVDPSGAETIYDTDGVGRVKAAAGDYGTAAQSYDKTGNVTSTTNPLGGTLSREYDALGNLVKEQTPKIWGSYKTTNRSAGGRALQVVNARNSTIAYEYDDRGLLSWYLDAHPDSQESNLVSYSYDEDGNVLEANSLVGGEVKRSYDALGRVTSATDANGNVTAYEYDERGNLASLTYPDGSTVSYAYDSLGRMSTVTDWAGRKTGYEYSVNGRLWGIVYPDGSTSIVHYDKMGRLGLQWYFKDGKLVESYSVRYDGAGMVAKESWSGRGVSYEYAYDGAGRVTSRTDGKGKRELFSYDAAGNATKVDDVFGAREMASDSQCAFRGTVPFDAENDADGNLASAFMHGRLSTFSYDSANRLTEASGVKYAYDAFDNRVSRTDADGEVATYAYNASSNSDKLLAATEGGETVKYVWGAGGLVGEERADGSWRSYRFDARGSTVALVDEAGEVTDSWEYGTYGAVSSHQGDSATPFLFNGAHGVMDDGDGVLYMRARYYSPELMRFLSPDPVRGSAAAPRTLNPYLFANGNPVVYVDPTGRAAALGHTALDLAGLAPGVGLAFDAVNGVWYLAEGDWASAALSAGAMVPGLGVGSTGAKLGGKALGAASKAGKADVFKKPKSGQSGKEAARDIPSWAQGERPYVWEDGKAFAKRLMDEKYGEGNYPTGARTEYSRLQKYADSHFE